MANRNCENSICRERLPECHSCIWRDEVEEISLLANANMKFWWSNWKNVITYSSTKRSFYNRGKLTLHKGRHEFSWSKWRKLIVYYCMRENPSEVFKIYSLRTSTHIFLIEWRNSIASSHAGKVFRNGETCSRLLAFLHGYTLRVCHSGGVWIFDVGSDTTVCFEEAKR